MRRRLCIKEIRARTSNVNRNGGGIDRIFTRLVQVFLANTALVHASLWELSMLFLAIAPNDCHIAPAGVID